MIKKFFKKITGLDKLEADIAEATRKKIEAELAAEKAEQESKDSIEKAKQEEEFAKLSPKERATANKEPWIEVLDTHVNKENVRNGFFELDWNEYFVLQLRSNGYQGDTDESIVDQWFQDLCRNIGAETGVDMDRRGSGFVNRALRDDGKTEIG
jgi:hypothetical protein